MTFTKLSPDHIQGFKNEGFVKLKGFFEPALIADILADAQAVFAKQMVRLGILNSTEGYDSQTFRDGMFSLFQKDLQAFMNAGKQVQHLVSLHQAALSESVIDTLKELGLSTPVVSTRPVLFFNHQKLAKEKVYHTVFPHQDWRSMQGSLDAVIIWLPLVPIDAKLGALQVIPGSHKMGLVATGMESGFGKVDITDEMEKQWVNVEVEPGDALFFSSFLIHQSGVNDSEDIRWSTHFRYNNLDESTFVERGYPHPYIYKPTEELLTKGFPNQELIKNIYQ